MSPTADQELAELRRANAELLRERDAALTALAQRNTEYGERIEYQAATIDVLKAMSASPGDPQPVFDLIVNRARDVCDAYGATVFEFDGTEIHWRAATGVSDDPAVRAAYEAQFPMVPTRGWAFGRAILDRRIIRIDDMEAEPGLDPTLRGITAKSNVTIPIMRGDAVIGAIGMGSREKGGFSESQVELLRTFAEQAAIAITSAEAYRALHEALEQQTATAEVLQVINASPGNLEPVFAAILNRAHTICGAEMGSLQIWDGTHTRAVATLGYPEAIDAALRQPTPPGRGQLALIAANGVSHRHDVTVEPALDERALEFRRLTGVRTNLLVPLRKDGACLGFVTANRREVRPFTDKEIRLLQNFAAQAVIAMENARLINETREALEQQTATAEVLRVINASPGNLAPVFDVMLGKATQLCEAAFGELWVGADSVRPVALFGVPAAYAEFRASYNHLSGPGSFGALLREGHLVIHVEDLAESEAYRNGDAGRRAMVDLGGARSAVAIPLLAGAERRGAIVIYRQEVRPFTEKQIALLQSFAAQAVIALENARLLTETREALEQQTATAEVLQVINTNPGNLAPVFATILEKAHATCGAEMGSLQMWDGTHARAMATLGYPSEVDAMLRRPFLPGPRQQAVLAGARLTHSTDVTLEHDADNIGDNFWGSSGIRTSLQVPLRHNGVVVGFITANRREVRPFSDKEIALLENFAAQAVIAMESARLLSEIRQRQEELRITFENMGDGVAMFDETQRLVAWNGKFQEVFDLPDGLLQQHRTYEEYLRFLAKRGDFGAGVDSAREIDELVASTGQPYGYERTRPDGRVIEIRRNPVPDGGFVLIFSDITERKRSEAEIRAARDAAEAAYRDLKAAQASLIQAEKMASLGQLTAGIAHEIKNPLNFVNNFASLSVDLLDELKQTVAPGLATLDEARRAEVDELANTLASNLDKINEHGRRADGIVRGMLEHSRGSSSERREVDLNVLVNEAVNLAYHGARAQDQSFSVTLQRELDEGIGPITLAPQDVTRVLLNLLSNGFYAARERQRTETMPGFEPTLNVSTQDLDGAVEIRVRDNGIGIPSEIKDRLFQPFFTTKPPGEGTGLGLSMSYDIITQQHGGSISVDSKVGGYSEFTVRLPRRS
jgi:two-component system NtrC family sensor kinase